MRGYISEDIVNSGYMTEKAWVQIREDTVDNSWCISEKAWVKIREQIHVIVGTYQRKRGYRSENR